MANADRRRTDDDQRGDSLEDSPTMAYLLRALKDGTDIGHYGRLTFVMVAQYFMTDDKIEALLAKQPDHGEEDAKQLVAQVKAHGYNPPRRDKILAWQREQEFPIIPNPDDPDSGNLYRELRFPDDIYENIGDYYEEKVEAREHADSR